MPKELRDAEIPLIDKARLLQFTAAGIDWVPTRFLPPDLPVAANKGGGTEPMSEHIVALALAAAKRLFIGSSQWWGVGHEADTQSRGGRVLIQSPMSVSAKWDHSVEPNCVAMRSPSGAPAANATTAPHIRAVVSQLRSR